MNAGTKYLFDSLMGLMMEVANLRTLVEQKDARIAELEKELAPHRVVQNVAAANGLYQSTGEMYQAAINANPAAEDM